MLMLVLSKISVYRMDGYVTQNSVLERATSSVALSRKVDAFGHARDVVRSMEDWLVPQVSSFIGCFRRLTIMVDRWLWNTIERIRRGL